MSVHATATHPNGPAGAGPFAPEPHDLAYNFAQVFHC